MASKNTSIALGEQLEGFVRQQVSTGAYGTVSEVVRAGLRMLAEREQRIAALRDAIREGEESGPARAFDFDAFLAERFPNA